MIEILNTAAGEQQAGDSMWENFEYLYVKAEDWEKTYGAHGTYPKHVRRVKIAPFSVPPAMGHNGAAHRETADVS